MSVDPIRLLDDESTPDALRDDLTEAANQPLPPVDMASGLSSLKAAIAAGEAAAPPALALAHGAWWGVR